MVQKFYTSGQVARKLHISISTLKRWLADDDLKVKEYRNYNGWRLFTSDDINLLQEYKKRTKKNGRRFKETTLIPIRLIEKE